MGWSMIALTVFNILMNILVMLYSTFMSFKHNYRFLKNKIKSLYQALRQRLGSSSPQVIKMRPLESELDKSISIQDLKLKEDRLVSQMTNKKDKIR